MKRPTQNRKTNKRQRGAALIITVVVVMLLTTLALTMASFTVTEERTATTYRDSQQVRQVAEAGIRVAQEMFRTPSDQQLVPLWTTASAGGGNYYGTTTTAVDTSLNAIGIWRADRAGANPARYSGNNNRFFQGPFKDTWDQVFGGTYDPAAANDRYDVKFNCTNPTSGAAVTPANCWLNTKINALLSTSANFTQDTGRITDISFYAPPSANGRAYGLTTIRVTASKFDGTDIVASETLEAVIIDINPKPAVLGNGNIVFKLNAGVMCGNGCEQIHANGTATVGTVTGGQNPMITATGTITGGSGSTKPGAKAVIAPEINPWDLEYKPKVAGDLLKYYLLAARPLDIIWTDNDATNGTVARPCGIDNSTFCQDYGLEYTPPTAIPPNVSKPRLLADVPQLYKWNTVTQGWTWCNSGDALSGGVLCPGAPTFSVSRAADQVVLNGGVGDNNDLPYAKDRVPQTEFSIGSAQVGATVLVDGRFRKQGAMTTTMSIIAVGSMDFSSSTTWAPALNNRVMWISGRDIDTHANCCAPSNTCATNLGLPASAAVIATHEQFLTGSQNALLGVLIAENRVNYDLYVNSTLAINSDNGDHGSLCGLPDWPWAMPVIPAIASMKTATN
ncbi:MAG: PilX N-terminal domain-containing pilus assembly protein [Acidobacteriota bacterium]